MVDRDTRQRHQVAIQELESIPRDLDGPVFSEPWQAEVFAITISLHAKGLFSWQEWSTALGETISHAIISGDPDPGNTYYTHWLITLEHMLVRTEIADQQLLNNLYCAWKQAALSTPHGQPIELSREHTE